MPTRPPSSASVFRPDVLTDGRPGPCLTDDLTGIFYQDNPGARRSDFRALQKDARNLFAAPPVLPPPNKVRGPTPNVLSTIKYVRKPGQLFTDFYQWKERVATGDTGTHNLSVIEALTPSRDAAKEQKRRGILGKLLKDKKGRERHETPLSALMYLCQQPRQWKAYAAKAISDRLCARTVCDSSGGWGDRLTGFLAAPSVKEITVIEPRRAACDAFKRQLEDAGVDKDLTVLNGPAEVMMEDVAGDIDLFLTSPPYVFSERYPGHDGGQVHQMVARGDIQNRRSSPPRRASSSTRSAFSLFGRLLCVIFYIDS